MADPKPPSRPRRFAVEYAVAALGVVAAALTFAGMRRAEQTKAALRFDAETAQRAAIVQRSLDEVQFTLRSIRETQEMKGALSRPDFSALAQRARRDHPGIVELVYVPIVEPDSRASVEQSARRDGYDDFIIHDREGGKRPREIPVRPELYIVPAPDVARFGLDRSEDPDFVASSARSVAEGRPTSLPTHVAGPKAIATVVAPLYGEDAPTFTRVGRAAFVVGHVILSFDPQLMLQAALAEEASTSSQLMFEGRGFAGVDGEAAADAAVTAEHALEYPGERWQLRSTATPDYYARHRTPLPYVTAGVVGFIALMLAFAFRQQRQQKQRVEREVEARTAELAARTRDMRRVFDHVDSGLLTIDYQGRMRPEVSAAVEAWFGPREGETEVVDYLRRTDPQSAEYLEVGLDQLADDWMPIEVSLGQLPRHWKKEGRTFESKYLPFEDEGGPALLVAFSDVTSQLEARERQVAQIELVASFERIVQDREGFLDFFASSSELVTQLMDRAEEDPVVVARHLHTLKGNCGFFELNSVSQICHRIEDRIAEEGGLPLDEELDELSKRWLSLHEDLQRFMGTDDGHVEITPWEYDRALKAAIEEAPHGRTRSLLEGWKNESVDRHFERIAARASKLASRLGKGDIEVIHDPCHLRLPKNALGPFWSSVTHVIRNAIDHGLEPAEERLAADKSAHGTLTLRAHRDPVSGEVTIELSDDGRGIDFDRLRAKAEASGRVFEADEDLLFEDGLSSRDEVSETSGRGVGMAAVKSAVVEQGGRIEIETARGRGTSFRFVFPDMSFSARHGNAEASSAPAASAQGASGNA